VFCIPNKEKCSNKEASVFCWLLFVRLLQRKVLKILHKLLTLLVEANNKVCAKDFDLNKCSAECVKDFDAIIIYKSLLTTFEATVILRAVLAAAKIGSSQKSNHYKNLTKLNFSKSVKRFVPVTIFD
jgi:hypothetical protein